MEFDFINIAKTFRVKVAKWIDDFVEHTPNIVLALLIFVLGFYLSRLVKNGISKFLKSKRVKPSAKNMIANIASLIVGITFLFLALNILNLDGMLKTLLAGAGVAGLAIGLALQGTLSNTFAGVVLSFREDLRIGDQIETNGYTGFIEDINLRMVKLRLSDGNLATIPNKLILENPIKNYSDKDHSNIILTCGVGYESDLEKVEYLVVETIKTLPDSISSEFPIRFFFTEFADSSINFEVRFFSYSKSIVDTSLVKSKAITAIKKTFDENNINIPFPIRTLNVPDAVLEKIKYNKQ